jgi:hypothetical protein
VPRTLAGRMRVKDGLGLRVLGAPGLQVEALVFRESHRARSSGLTADMNRLNARRIMRERVTPVSDITLTSLDPGGWCAVALRMSRAANSGAASRDGKLVGGTEIRDGEDEGAGGGIAGEAVDRHVQVIRIHLRMPLGVNHEQTAPGDLWGKTGYICASSYA